MKAWYAAIELRGLPGMPGTERRVRARAIQQGWKSRERMGRGGGQEFAWDALPETTRRFLLDGSNAQLPLAVEGAPPAPAIPADTAALKDWQRRRLEGRLTVLRYVDTLAGQLHISQEKALFEIVTRARAGTLPEPVQQAVRAANAHANGALAKRVISRRTIKRWKADHERGALAPKAPKAEAPPAWAPALLRAYRQPQKPSLVNCLRDLQAEGALPKGIAVPSYDQARRFLARLGAVQRQRGRMGTRELKSIRPFRRRDTTNLLPCDVYIADGHTFHAEVAHPIHGRAFRPEVTLILDVATRRVPGWALTLAESGLATLDALRHGVTRRGIPALFYADNGGGYANKMMEHPATGFMARLGIEMTHSIAYNPQGHGMIERHHQSILVRAARTLPTYVGDDMDDQARKAAFQATRADASQLLPWAEFCRLIDLTIYQYERRPHRGLPKIGDPVTGKRRHQSPLEAWEAAVAQGWAPEVPSEAEAADLFRPEILRTAQRGEISLFGNRYFSAALEESHGSQVRVGYDVWDPSRVWVRDPEGVLLCVATLDGNKSDYFPKSVIEMAQAKRADGRRKRLEVRRAEIDAEAGTLPELPAPEPQPLTKEERRAAARLSAASGEAAVQADAEPDAASVDGGRPVFSGEFAERDWGRWCRDNYGALDSAERAMFLRRLENSVFRELVGLSAEDLQALG
jgi:putative transposase